MKRILLSACVMLWTGVVQAQQISPPDIKAEGCSYNAVLPTITTGNYALVQCDVNGKLVVTATQGAYTPLTPMQSGLGVASSTALTVPTGATYAVVCAYSQAVNYTTDGTTTPTTTASGAGMQLAVGSCLPLAGATVIANFRAIQQAATATLSVSYFK